MSLQHFVSRNTFTSGIAFVLAGVRLDRVRGGRQKYKRGAEMATTISIPQSSSPQAKIPCYDGKLLPLSLALRSISHMGIYPTVWSERNILPT